jgi:putative phosphoesterase
MKFLIASDIHGSLSACRNLLSAYDREGAARLILLGDLLYHGPRNPLSDEYNPGEAARMLNTLAEEILCVRGNCDAEVDQMLLSFPIMADYAVLQAGEHLMFMTHGHLFGKDKLPPVKKGDVYLTGHTHVPALLEKDGILYANPGSVGLPKNGSERGYLLLEKETFYLKNIKGDVISNYSISSLGML